MHSYTLFCPYCFGSKRSGSPKCNRCGQQMVTLSYKVRLPKQNSEKGWKNFFIYFKDWGFIRSLPNTKKVRKYRV